MLVYLTNRKRNTVSGSELIHTQGAASATWVVTHNFGYYPIVRVFSDFGNGLEEFIPEDIVHDSLNQVTITFIDPYDGEAKLA